MLLSGNSINLSGTPMISQPSFKSEEVILIAVSIGLDTCSNVAMDNATSKLSSSLDSLLPITPGNNLKILSITTKAADSPPD